MHRTIASFLLCATLSVVSAQNEQRSQTPVQAKAAERTAMVAKVVELTADQRTNLNTLYAKLEQRMADLEERATLGRLTPEQRETEIAPQRKAMESDELKGLKEILTPSELQKWRSVVKR